MSSNYSSPVYSGGMSAQINTAKISGPQADVPRSAGTLDAYGLNIQAVNSKVEYYGGHTNVDIDVQIRTNTLGEHSLNGSEALADLERFLTDIDTLNKIKKSTQVPVQDLWSQLETLIALTEEKDK